MSEETGSEKIQKGESLNDIFNPDMHPEVWNWLTLKDLADFYKHSKELMIAGKFKEPIPAKLVNERAMFETILHAQRMYENHKPKPDKWGQTHFSSGSLQELLEGKIAEFGY